MAIASSPRTERSAAASDSKRSFQAGSWGTTSTCLMRSRLSTGPALAAAVQGVHEDGEEDYDALDELDPEGRDVKQGEAVVERADKEDANERTAYATAPPEEGGTPDDNGRDDLELQPFGGRGQGRVQAARQDYGREPRAEAGDHVHQERDPPHGDAGKPGGLPVAADGVDLVAEDRV